MSEQVFAECLCDSLRVCHTALLRLSELSSGLGQRLPRALG